MNNTVRKVMKYIAATLAIFLFCAASLIAVTAAKPHHFEGRIKMICDPKGKANLSAPTDVLTASVVIPFDVLSAATNRQVSSRFAWLGKSAKGNSAGWSLGQPGNAFVNAASGKIELRLPFQATYNNHTFSVPLILTTESITDGFGPNQGRRASPGTLNSNVTLVGGFEFTIDKKKANPNSPESGAQIMVVRAIVEGQFKAVDGSPIF